MTGMEALIGLILFGVIVVVLIVVFTIVAVMLSNALDKSESNTTEKNSEADEIIPKVKKYVPYALNDYFLTDNEASFFRAILPLALKHNLYIFAKPRIADFVYVTVEKYEKGSQWNTHFNKIAKKHIDFLLCDGMFSPVVGFEVDDSTHFQYDRAMRDRFVDEIYEGIGLRVHHVWEWWDNDLLEQYIIEKTHKE
jgi:hypothetical protein